VQTALLIVRIALGVIFLYAAYTKLHFAGSWHLRDYHFIFAFGINSYEILSLENALLLARVLPWLEIAIGILLISGIGLRWVGAFTTLLLVIFMIALARAESKGLAINCGCFGNQSTSPGKELGLDSLFLLATLAVTAGAFLTHRARRLA
jgi:uncharacterized membrane protein YphA (DoxX/SURF4 family)